MPSVTKALEKWQLENITEPDEYAGLRCPRCMWALYDGVYGMNPDCYCYGKRLRKRIRLTNTEAQKKIVALSLLREVAPDDDGGRPDPDYGF